MTRLVIALALLALCGCHESNRSVPQTPSDAVPSVIPISVGDFTDTDQNRYRDSTTITAYLHAAAYPIPLAARGSFEFELQSGKGVVLNRWTFNEQQTAAAMRQMAPGPGYVFNLSLVGKDRIEQTEGEIVCTFRPTSGQPVHARSGLVAIGPVARSRGSN